MVPQAVSVITDAQRIGVAIALHITAVVIHAGRDDIPGIVQLGAERLILQNLGQLQKQALVLHQIQAALLRLTGQQGINLLLALCGQGRFIPAGGKGVVGGQAVVGGPQRQEKRLFLQAVQREDVLVLTGRLLPESADERGLVFRLVLAHFPAAREQCRRNIPQLNGRQRGQPKGGPAN